MVLLNVSLRHARSTFCIIRQYTSVMDKSVLLLIAKPNLRHCFKHVTNLPQGLFPPGCRRYLLMLLVLREVAIMQVFGDGFKHLSR